MNRNVLELHGESSELIADSEGFTTYHVMRAGIRRWPFPHIAVNTFFHPAVYGILLAAMPSHTHFRTLQELARVSASYPTERKVVPLDILRELPKWSALMKWLASDRFLAVICAKFGIDAQFPPDILLCRDAPGYFLGPHTDAPHKRLSMIVYLSDENMTDPARGTHIYLPRKYGFACPGGPHYSVTDFARIATFPYAQNHAFAFKKTNNSFHGVEKAPESRTVLIYDLRG